MHSKQGIHIAGTKLQEVATSISVFELIVS